MTLLTRLIETVLLLGVLLFCLFGFLATFEPLDRTTQWLWRVIYVLVGIASLIGVLRLLGKRRATKTPPGRDRPDRR
ncbi:MAG: hypothetical protein ACK5EA_08440 [Planctomycetaceae bacterium]|jgi:hypothetical protein